MQIISLVTSTGDFFANFSVALRQERRGEFQNIFVFGDKEDRAITANSVNHHVRRIVPATSKTAYYGLERWTPHDLRRTAATGFRRLGASRDEMDLILGHRAGGVTGVYDRHSGEAEKEKWLSAWGEYVYKIVVAGTPQV